MASRIRVSDPFSSGFAALVHEFAHNRHELLDDCLSAKWMNIFGDDLSEVSHNDWEMAADYGMVDPYAAFSYGSDSHETSDAVSRRLRNEVSEGSTNVASCDRFITISNGMRVAEEVALLQLCRQIRKLPGKLGDDLGTVVLDPKMGYTGDFTPSSDVSAAYDDCCEDIAVHTEEFTAALIDPSSNYRTVQMLATNDLTSLRLDTLIEFDFLDEDYRHQLREQLILHRIVLTPQLLVPYSFIDAISKGTTVLEDQIQRF
ncbi:hypothetical protein CL619_03810 [archaeon]|nr:hypothetical protein [archaeon]